MKPAVVVRLVKLIIISLFSLALLIFIISLFLPSHIRISRTIRIDSSSQAVMKELSNPLKWKDWYPDADSAELFYESGVVKGLILNRHPWLALVINETREYEIMASYNKENGNNKLLTSIMIFPEPGFNHVMVQWYMDFRPGWYPWQKFASLMYDKVYGSLMEKGLIRLKNVVQAK